MRRALPPSPNGMLNLSCATCSPPSSAARRKDSTGWTASRASSADRSRRFFSHIALLPLSHSSSRYQPRCTAIPWLTDKSRDVFIHESASVKMPPQHNEINAFSEEDAHGEHVFP